jgi:hypothetical protein
MPPAGFLVLTSNVLDYVRGRTGTGKADLGVKILGVSLVVHIAAPCYAIPAQIIDWSLCNQYS